MAATLPKFISISTDPHTKPARCVDGRADPDSLLGPQMLGGSLHPIIIWCISQGFNLDENRLSEGLTRLSEAGFITGLHIDDHAQSPMCGCGFCDRLPEILTIAGEKIDISTQAQLCRRPLIDFARSKNAHIEIVTGSHDEKVAFVNSIPLTTFNTHQAVSEGWQAFNLDLWSAVVQSQTAFGVNPSLAKKLSLELYQATEVVLVESKGKPKLAIVEVS